jgi:hypothetical protein
LLLISVSCCGIVGRAPGLGLSGRGWRPAIGARRGSGGARGLRHPRELDHLLRDQAASLERGLVGVAAVAAETAAHDLVAQDAQRVRRDVVARADAADGGPAR